MGRPGVRERLRRLITLVLQRGALPRLRLVPHCGGFPARGLETIPRRIFAATHAARGARLALLLAGARDSMRWLWTRLCPGRTMLRARLDSLNQLFMLLVLMVGGLRRVRYPRERRRAA